VGAVDAARGIGLGCQLPPLGRLERRHRRWRRRCGLVARAAHELVAREQVAQLGDMLRARRLFRRRDAVARGRDSGGRQQRGRQPARGVDLKIANEARHWARDGKGRQRRALHEVRRGIARDDQERIVAERARVLCGDRRAQRRVDAPGELLCCDLRAAKRLPLELAVRLPDQHGRGNRERQEKQREHELEAALVESLQRAAFHALTTSR
jgi:hypothetical protein